MIVEPDFLDHWKTRLLVRMLGTELAPIHVLRLWAHCQQRKTDRFTGWKPVVLASVCRWDGDAETLWTAMAETFIHIEGDTVIVHGWAETNASLVSAWANGKLGGRPRKPTVYEPPKPAENRPVNPQQTDRVSDREEKIEKRRVEEKENKARFAPPTRDHVLLEAAKCGLPEVEVDKFLAYYGSNGWRVGKSPMRSWQHALSGWTARWRERTYEHSNNGAGRHGQLTPAERRNAVIAGADAIQQQAIRTAQREAEMVARGELPL